MKKKAKTLNKSRPRLKCPDCGEETIYMSVNGPHEIYCLECDSSQGIDSIVATSITWLEFAVKHFGSKIKVPKNVEELKEKSRNLDLE